MDTSRIEELLEQLIEIQIQLISRIDSLEIVIEQGLAEANSSISELQSSSSQIFEELNWWGESPSLAKQVLAALDGIETAASQS
jgi:hypothetical protein